MKLGWMIAAVVATLMCGSADATLYTYDVDGVFASGRTLTGNFSFDDGAPEFNQFSNASFTISGLGTVVRCCGLGYDAYKTGIGEIVISLSNFPSFSNFPSSGVIEGLQVNLFFTADHTSGKINSIVLPESLTAPLINASYFYIDHGFQMESISSGTITQRAAAVPEPATWAMFIGGFGLIGSAMRRRQKVAVTFA